MAHFGATKEENTGTFVVSGRDIQDIRVPLVAGAKIEYNFMADRPCDLQTSLPTRTATGADGAGPMRTLEPASGIYEAPFDQQECPRELVFTFSNPSGDAGSTTVQYGWTRQSPAGVGGNWSPRDAGNARSGRKGHRPGQESMVAEQERRRLEKQAKTWKRSRGGAGNNPLSMATSTGLSSAAPPTARRGHGRTPSGAPDAGYGGDDDEQGAIKMAIDMTGEPQPAHIVSTRKKAWFQRQDLGSAQQQQHNEHVTVHFEERASWVEADERYRHWDPEQCKWVGANGFPLPEKRWNADQKHWTRLSRDERTWEKMPDQNALGYLEACARPTPENGLFPYSAQTSPQDLVNATLQFRFIHLDAGYSGETTQWHDGVVQSWEPITDVYGNTLGDVIDGQRKYLRVRHVVNFPNDKPPTTKRYILHRKYFRVKQAPNRSFAKHRRDLYWTPKGAVQKSRARGVPDAALPLPPPPPAALHEQRDQRHGQRAVQAEGGLGGLPVQSDVMKRYCRGIKEQMQQYKVQLLSVKDDLVPETGSDEDESKDDADDTSARAIPLVGELDDLCTFAYAYDTERDRNIRRAVRFMRDGDNWEVIAPERGREELFVTDVPGEKIQRSCYLSQARGDQHVQDAARCWCADPTDSDLGYTETMTRNMYEQEVVVGTIAEQKVELRHALFDELDELKAGDIESMDSICVSDDSYRSIVQRQAYKDYHCSHWRELRSDTDSYYRAVGFALFERAFGGGDKAQPRANVDERRKLIERFRRVKFGDGAEKQRQHDELLRFMDEAHRQGSWAGAQTYHGAKPKSVAQSFCDTEQGTDAAVVHALRWLTADFLRKHQKHSIPGFQGTTWKQRSEQMGRGTTIDLIIADIEAKQDTAQPQLLKLVQEVLPLALRHWSICALHMPRPHKVEGEGVAQPSEPLRVDKMVPYEAQLASGPMWARKFEPAREVVDTQCQLHILCAADPQRGDPRFAVLYPTRLKIAPGPRKSGRMVGYPLGGTLSTNWQKPGELGAQVGVKAAHLSVQLKRALEAEVKARDRQRSDGVEFNVQVVSAKGLGRADGPFMQSDPYCKVLWKGSYNDNTEGGAGDKRWDAGYWKVLQTKHKRQTLQPRWDAIKDNAVTGTIRSVNPPLQFPPHRNDPIDLIIECWDWDLGGELTSDDFLGAARMDRDQIIAARDSGRSVELDLVASTRGHANTYVKQGAKITILITPATGDHDLVGKPGGALRLLASRQLNYPGGQLPQLDKLAEHARLICNVSAERRPKPGPLEQALEASDVVYPLPQQLYHAQNVTPTAHASVQELFADFVALKVAHGSPAEVNYYRSSIRRELMSPAMRRSSSAVSQVPRDFKLVIVSASGLVKSDTFGSSDPYCKVFWMGKQLGYTKAKSNTLTPKWSAQDDNAVFDKGQLVWPNPAEVEASAIELKLQLWDADTVGQDDFLGEVVMKDYDLIDAITERKSYIDLHLQPDHSKLAESKYNKYVGSKAKLRVKISGTMRDTAAPASADASGASGAAARALMGPAPVQDRSFFVHIKEAENLAAADTFTSDPYCIVYWTGGFVGTPDKFEHKTKYKSRTLSPKWHPVRDNARPNLIWPAPPHNPPLELVIECWDHDTVGKDDFLGQMRLSEKEIMLRMEQDSAGQGLGHKFELEAAADKDRKYIKKDARLTVAFLGDIYMDMYESTAAAPGGITPVPEAHSPAAAAARSSYGAGTAGPSTRDLQIASTLVTELLRKRPLACFGADDRFLLRDGKSTGRGGFDLVGTAADKVKQHRPSQVAAQDSGAGPQDIMRVAGRHTAGATLHNDYLSLDEQSLAGLLLVPTPTTFIGSGGAGSKGRNGFGYRDSFEPEGVVVELPVPQLDSPNRADARHMLVTPQCTESAGYGEGAARLRSGAYESLKPWAKFYAEMGLGQGQRRHKQSPDPFFESFDVVAQAHKELEEAKLVASSRDRRGASGVHVNEKANVDFWPFRAPRVTGVAKVAAASEAARVDAGAAAALRTFTVQPIQAEGLAAADVTTSDPYCKVMFNGQVMGSTKYKSNTLSPRWDAEKDNSVISCEWSSPDAGKQTELVIECYDHDTFGKDDFLGAVVLHGDQLLRAAQSGAAAVEPLVAMHGKSAKYVKRGALLTFKVTAGTSGIARATPVPSGNAATRVPPRDVDETTWFLNSRVYKQRLGLVLEPLLLDANERGHQAGKKAYVRIMDLCSGHFAQRDLQVMQSHAVFDVVADILGGFALQYIGDVDFVGFPIPKGSTAEPPNCGGVADGGTFPDVTHCGNEIVIHFSDTKKDGIAAKVRPLERAKSSRRGDDRLLVVAFPATANSYPGNEFWPTLFSPDDHTVPKSDAADAAACSFYAQLSAPEVNPRVAHAGLCINWLPRPAVERKPFRRMGPEERERLAQEKQGGRKKTQQLVSRGVYRICSLQYPNHCVQYESKSAGLHCYPRQSQRQGDVSEHLLVEYEKPTQKYRLTSHKERKARRVVLDPYSGGQAKLDEHERSYSVTLEKRKGSRGREGFLIVLKDSEREIKVLCAQQGGPCKVMPAKKTGDVLDQMLFKFERDMSQERRY